jgi:hypothetical protein
MNKIELDEFINTKKSNKKPLKEKQKSQIEKYEKVLKTVIDEIIYLKKQNLGFSDIVEFLEKKRELKIPKKILIYFYKKNILKNKSETLENLIKESNLLKDRFEKIMSNYQGKRVSSNGYIYEITNYSISNDELHLGVTSSDKNSFEVIEISPKNGGLKEQIEKLIIKEM